MGTSQSHTTTFLLRLYLRLRTPNAEGHVLAPGAQCERARLAIAAAAWISPDIARQRVSRDLVVEYAAADDELDPVRLSIDITRRARTLAVHAAMLGAEVIDRLSDDALLRLTAEVEGMVA